MPDQALTNTIKSALTGDALQNALGFVDFLAINGFAVNGSEVSHHGKTVCYMHLDSSSDYPSPWTIWTDGDYSGAPAGMPISDQTKETAWENVNICAGCGGGCAPGQRKTIFGKAFDNVCSADMAFYMPNADALACVKTLLQIRKHTLSAGAGA